ncbi:hypothetical protein BN14_10326 [Rhizoctonia solani AG-1 IB]|uniref:Uncharacterized protein n=1 Tax=Thanatephorus cucumeris (strain AG1-IB / isolate 7/3/14) TaxID=1108050 RepID=M5C8A5_THACB|nr:hypothetical protein BN14_10326 [Rhizoctonia solani AG-1 IB]
MADAKLEAVGIDRIAEISRNIREAVRAALPTPPEQFFTLMVPGKVVDLDMYKVHEDRVILPLATELNQAILCDDMPVLSTIQLGPTGRSVARSYAATINKLKAAGTPIGIDDGGFMTPDQKRYKQAMKILSSEIPEKPGRSLVELYTEKQAVYTKSVANKTKAFQEALQLAKDDPTNKNPAQIRQAYDQWVAENARTYRNNVQATYMDWVITGKKEEVEYWFSVVDQDSALAREVMRWAVVQDSDGSCEYQKVKLEPADWANKCLDKMKSGANQTKTAEWYTWEINRLEQTNALLEVLTNSPPKFGADGTSDDNESLKKEAEEAKDALAKALTEQIQARHDYNAALSESKQLDADGKEDKDAKKKKVQEAFKKHEDAEKNLKECRDKCAQVNHNKLSFENKAAHDGLINKLVTEGSFKSKLEENNRKIEQYKSDRAKLLGGGTPDQAIQTAAQDTGIPPAAPEPQAPTDAVKATPDFFTPITVEVSSSSEKKSTEESATSFAAGASASWGLWSVSASVSHSEAHSKAMSELAESSIKISFECMRVDINRPWLRPELFYDEELVPGPDVLISPGFGRLRALMEGKVPVQEAEKELQQYSVFPLYPVAFLVACNVVLEISGSTSSLETYMNSSSTSASASVGYGPFSINGSGSHSNSNSGSTCKSTASGCRIEIKSPQIIGWISQMVPALPRLDKKSTFQSQGFSQGGFQPVRSDWN